MTFVSDLLCSRRRRRVAATALATTSFKTITFLPKRLQGSLLHIFIIFDLKCSRIAFFASYFTSQLKSLRKLTYLQSWFLLTMSTLFGSKSTFKNKLSLCVNVHPTTTGIWTHDLSVHVSSSSKRLNRFQTWTWKKKTRRGKRIFTT